MGAEGRARRDGGRPGGRRFRAGRAHDLEPFADPSGQLTLPAAGKSGQIYLIVNCYFDETRLGISLHLIDDDFDHGDIVMQQDFELEPPVSRRAIEHKAASLGAELFLQALDSHDDPGWQLIQQR